MANKLLPWDLVIFLNFLEAYQISYFEMNQVIIFVKCWKPRIRLSLEFYFYFTNGCDSDKSPFHVIGCPYCVHSCASDVILWMAMHYCQLGSDLDCMVLNTCTRSEPSPPAWKLCLNYKNYYLYNMHNLNQFICQSSKFNADYTFKFKGWKR